MTDAAIQTNVDSQIPSKGTTQSRLRLWPAVLFVLALGLARLWANTGEMQPSKFFFGLFITPILVMAGLQLWWLFASRLPWFDRLLVFGVYLGVAIATILIAGKNFPGRGLIFYALPIVAALWVGWLVISIPLPWAVRRAGILLIFVAIGVVCSLLRVDGMDGSFVATFNWRWTPTSETKLLSELKAVPKPSESAAEPVVAELVLQEGDWPCFRGPQRDGHLAGVRIRTDWDKTPPKEIWRHRIGPGWSSFAVIGNRLFTQEQRGEIEAIVCYDVETGQEVWSHKDTTRFEEVVAGAGPRGTPTFHEGRIYALGATGKINCLNAATGTSEWCADIVKDSQAKLPPWGFAASPLISHGLVSVFAGGPDGKSVLAYHIDSGELAWASGDGPKPGEGLHSYCSMQPATIDGVEQVLIATNVGLTSFEPEQGGVLWEHRWPVEQARVVQPALIGGSDILLGTGMTGGIRRLGIQHNGDQWQAEPQWTKKTIKPYYNDLVVLDENLYGFDNDIFMCVSLTDGNRKWRTRGYGNGQVLLLVDDAVLLILTEQGEVALVRAQPDSHVELARIKAITGKTWNHPVIAHGKLFVRNAEEIACLSLPLVDSKPTEAEATNP